MPAWTRARTVAAMNRVPRALIAVSVWVASLQGAAAEPATARAPAAAAPRAATEPPPTAATTRLEPNAAAPQSPRKLEYSTQDWRRLLGALPELSSPAKHFVTLDAATTDKALECGKRTRANVSAWSFVDGPFEWALGGQALWIVSGRIERGILLSVLSPSAQGPRHRASTIIAEPNAAIAIGLSTEHPQQLLWTTCYGSLGQSGSIELTKDGSPSFVYR